MVQKLLRIEKGEIRGLQYNGMNLNEVIRMYYPKQGTVNIDLATLAIKYLRNDRQERTINVTDWVVYDEGRTFVLTDNQFRRSYRFAETPKGYKEIDSATGLDITRRASEIYVDRN